MSEPCRGGQQGEWTCETLYLEALEAGAQRKYNTVIQYFLEFLILPKNAQRTL